MHLLCTPLLLKMFGGEEGGGGRKGWLQLQSVVTEHVFPLRPFK